MVNLMYKSKFAIDGIPTDESPAVEGYSDGTTWNGWEKVHLTREESEKWLNPSRVPYSFREAKSELNPREIPVLAILWPNDDEEIIESNLIQTNDGLLRLYDFTGYCFDDLNLGESHE